MRISVGQFGPVGDVEENLAVMARLAARAAGEGAELLVLPEEAMLGAREVGEEFPDAVAAAWEPFAAGLAALAREHGIAVVAGGYGVAECDSGEAGSASVVARSRLRILPVAVLGRLSTTTTSRGYLYAARETLACSMTPAGVTLMPGRVLTTATTSLPREGCGRPTTATSETAGCVAMTSSTSRGYTFMPPRRRTSSRFSTSPGSGLNGRHGKRPS